MFKKLLLCASLLVSSISLANISEAEAAQLAQDIEAGMQIIKNVGGFYLVTISKIPAAQIKTIKTIIATASKSETCVDYRSDDQVHLLVFCGPEGSQEAQGIKQVLEKKGCEVELLEMVYPNE